MGIADQVGEKGEGFECTVNDVWLSAQKMFSMGQTAFLPSDELHSITKKSLNAIKAEYDVGCQADDAEGCHYDFGSYDYDGLALVAQTFHKWLYDDGHTLAEIDYLNP